MSSPNRGDLQNALLGISILSPNDVWAVGEYNPGVPPTETGRRTLAEHWNGSGWSLVDTPDPSWQGLDLARLEAVDGTAANDVWAVGHADDFASLRSTTLVEHWNGQQWQLVRSPNPAGADRPNMLHDVVAIAPGTAWAVGETGFPGRALTLRWNGKRWRNVANACGVALRGVAAVSPGELWAVGDNTTCRFAGGSWRVVPSPQPRPEFNELAYQLVAVSAAAPDDVWAVGARAIEAYDYVEHVSFAEHWDGTRWTAFYNVAGQAMRAVYAISNTNAWAVGTDGARQLILHWDGSTWSPVPTPSPDHGGSLEAVERHRHISPLECRLVR